MTDTAITLIGGHSGIYQVAVGETVLYSNQQSCTTPVPTDADLVAQIAQIVGFDAAPTQGPIQMIEQDEGASCPIISSLETPEPEPHSPTH
ncbi:MAG: hypothetical protein AAGF73_04410 [Actinomycetota bacterium]